MVQYWHYKKRAYYDTIRGDQKSKSNQDSKSQRQNPRSDQRPQFVRDKVDGSSDCGRGGSIKNDCTEIHFPTSSLRLSLRK